MPIIAKAQKGDDNHNLIKKFKKLLQLDNPVEEVKERRYHKPAAVKRKEARKELEGRLKRERSLARRAAR